MMQIHTGMNWNDLFVICRRHVCHDFHVSLSFQPILSRTSVMDALAFKSIPNTKKNNTDQTFGILTIFLALSFYLPCVNVYATDLFVTLVFFRPIHFVILLLSRILTVAVLQFHSYKSKIGINHQRNRLWPHTPTFHRHIKVHFWKCSIGKIRKSVSHWQQQQQQ